MNITKYFQSIANPEFMQKIDRHLLLNRPFIWSSGFHYVVYYGFIINLVLIFLTLILIRPHQIDELTSFIVLFLYISEIFAFFFWMFRQSIFNLEKDFGMQKHFLKQSILEIIIYLFCTLIIFSPSVAIPLSAMHKIAYEVTINENTFCENEDFKSKLTTSYDEITYSKTTRQVKAEEICSDIKYFTAGDNSYTQNKRSSTLPYDIYLSLTILFVSVIGIPILVIQKYGGWKSVSLTSLWGFATAAIVIPIIIILNTLNIDFLENTFFNYFFSNSAIGNSFLILSIIAIFLLLQSIRIIRKNNYSLVLVINLAFLSVVINFILLTILLEHQKHPGLWFVPFVILLMVYSCLFPIQKKILLRNLSLPKIK